MSDPDSEIIYRIDKILESRRKRDASMDFKKVVLWALAAIVAGGVIIGALRALQ